jgi:NADH-quinone oxidoreductase subunit N
MNSFVALFPLLSIVAGALVILLLEVFLKRENRDYLAYVALLFLLNAGRECIRVWSRNYSYFDSSLRLDNLALFLCLILVLATLFVVLISKNYLKLQNCNTGEYYALLMFALSGMMIMVSTQDLLVIFLGLEVLSMSSYALAGLKRGDEKSVEASVKYFLLGSFASAFLVFGIALLYGATDSTDILSVVRFFQAENGLSVLGLAGLGLLIVGFGFKIAVVPFHMWTPDVYEGSPTPITAFFSVGPKAVGFIVLLRVFDLYWSSGVHAQLIFSALWGIAVLTMVAGNLIALRQKNVKRILAYSSIAHAGYLMIAILAKDSTGLIFYLTVYLFMNLGAFAAVTALAKKDTEYVDLEDFKGIGFRYPWIGATLLIFLISLAGFPPTGGFLAKFYIFSSAVREGLIPIVIIGVLASLISVFYYLRIVVTMYMQPVSRDIEIEAYNPALFLVLFLCLYGVLQMGLFPGNILVIIKQAVASLPIL